MPSELRRLKGLPTDETPKPVQGEMRCPDHLDIDGRKCWARTTAYLSDLRVLSATDADTIMLYCAAYSLWLQAQRDIQANGPFYISQNGYKQQSAAVGIAAQCLKQMQGLLADMGLSPAARAKLRVLEQEPDADPLSEFLARRKDRQSRQS